MKYKNVCYNFLDQKTFKINTIVFIKLEKLCYFNVKNRKAFQIKLDQNWQHLGYFCKKANPAVHLEGLKMGIEDIHLLR